MVREDISETEYSMFHTVEVDEKVNKHTFLEDSAAVSMMGYCKTRMFDSEEYIMNIQVGNYTIIKSELKGKNG